jgi:hypothetical protein
VDWDLGFQGVALLLGMSIAFGVVAQAVMWKATTHWLWLSATVAYFVSGLLVSEVWFGWATEDDLQPNIDGLSFDEVLGLATLAGIAVVALIWLVGRRPRAQGHV